MQVPSFVTFVFFVVKKIRENLRIKPLPPSGIHHKELKEHKEKPRQEIFLLGSARNPACIAGHPATQSSFFGIRQDAGCPTRKMRALP